MSILIPAYNAMRWLPDAVESALAQTWPRKEVIIVDDGSSDATLEVARRFNSASVQVITQPNQGAAAARNAAFSICQGAYIQWLDADDILAPDKISKQLEALDQSSSTRTLLSSAWGHFLYRTSRARFVPSPLWCNLSPFEWHVRKFEHDAFMAIQSWLIGRELSEAAGPWDTQLSMDDDGEYISRVVLASDGIRFVPEARSFYRLPQTGNLSRANSSPRKVQSLFLSFTRQIRSVLAMDDSDRTRNACLGYLQENLIDFYRSEPNLVPQLQELARSLGGRLEVPRWAWKYAWIESMFGWTAAKRAQDSYNEVKWSVMRSWDHALYLLERGVSNSSGTKR